MGVALLWAAWTLVMQLTVMQCQGERCQTVSSTVSHVRTFATQAACVESQQRYQAHTPARQETQAQGVGQLQQKTAWVCQSHAE